MRHTIENLSTRATTLLQTSSQLEVCMQSYEAQSCMSPNFGNFETPKWPFGCEPRGDAHSIL